ncbi:uncharacterized protein SPPG_09262 [Spizellomyces punctatus DAOM BR117]|uniref:Uncharacterized protein n=1 Tax=Spizellomyces punctatus (strain DAOM BR117) TaxID=645134 RepID=A0A0L0HF96_SPIPD|nr:uncharacterized protein SPPG_09262 [Spizellomyces punctatus DAOM BR117]KNC99792.1 hypothetical protein SPPG_09262 [Spizellomyces punctatus DAOM BR117]|eukprot:XP_016607832.1 hypothetical protein SPPG_09262 [Spizellomyces punctatus DAOM BR117]
MSQKLTRKALDILLKQTSQKPKRSTPDTGISDSSKRIKKPVLNKENFRKNERLKREAKRRELDEKKRKEDLRHRVQLEEEDDGSEKVANNLKYFKRRANTAKEKEIMKKLKEMKR